MKYLSWLPVINNLKSKNIKTSLLQEAAANIPNYSQAIDLELGLDTKLQT